MRLRETKSRAVFLSLIACLATSVNAQVINVDPLQKLLEKASKAIENSVTGEEGSSRLFDRYQARKEPSVLRQLVELAPKKGQAAAANFVGCIYGLGIGVPVDEAKAVRYFAHSAKNYPLGAYNYGLALAKANKGDMAYRAMESAWSRGGYEQAGAWLLRMREARRLDIRQLVIELDSIESPVGQYHEAVRLHGLGEHRAALGKLVKPASYGLIGSHGLLAKIYLDAHVTSPSKFFDWVAGLSHVYIENGISGEVWGVPAVMNSNAVGAQRAHFESVYHRIEHINREAHSRATQWFRARLDRPTRYEVYLCKQDRIFNRKTHNLMSK